MKLNVMMHKGDDDDGLNKVRSVGAKNHGGTTNRRQPPEYDEGDGDNDGNSFGNADDANDKDNCAVSRNKKEATASMPATSHSYYADCQRLLSWWCRRRQYGSWPG